MLLIPIGLIFVLFYINITVNGVTVDILADALGYILIAAGALKLRKDCAAFNKPLPLCGALAVLSVLSRLIRPTGLTGLAVSLAELVMQISLLYLLVDGVEALERVVGTHLNSAVLARWCRLLSVGMAASYICVLMRLFLPVFITIGYIAAAAWMILGALFIIVFFRTQHRYRLLLKSKQP